MKQPPLFGYNSPFVFILYLFLFSNIFYGCLSTPEKTGNKKSIDDLFNQYKQENTIKFDALHFLVKQLHHHIDDSLSITGEYLRKNIDQAYEQCKNDLQSGVLSFTDFCEFILPYRLENEPVEDWRQLIYDQYGHIFDSLTKLKKTKAEIVAVFNKVIGKGFEYGNSMIPIKEKSWSMLNQYKNGTCTEMTHMIAYPLRAFGIPVSIDYSICWANSNGYGHMWNALITPEKSIPFMGLEANPDNVYTPFTLITNKNPEKTTYRRCGKVFRKTFSVNEQIRRDDPIFGDKPFFEDVTSAYYKVSDLSFSLSDQRDDKHYYICNYTHGEWVPVFYGIKQKEHILFKNMAARLLYLPVIYDTSEKMSPLDFPVGITETGPSLVFKPDLQKRITIKIKTTQPIEEDQLAAINRTQNWDSEEFATTLAGIIDGKQRSKPKNNELYNLYYWNNDWRIIATVPAANNELKFTNVPSNALYKVAPAKSKGHERPFSYYDNTQQWW